MMTIKKEKLIKKVIGIMVFIMAMITIITNVNTQKYMLMKSHLK